MLREKEVRLEDKYIRWFSELGKENVKDVGGKAANLGEMSKLGLPVPQGFAITSQGYEYFLEETGLKEEIYSLLSSLDIEDTKKLDEVSVKIKQMIQEAEMPEELEEEIRDSYNTLSFDVSESATKDVMNILKMSEPVFVAVRSSATAEDSSEASFAGQQETFLNVKGSSNLIEAVKACFASLFTSRSIYYRVKKGFKHESVFIAVVVQMMVNADKSGVIFSKDPVENTDNVVVEAVFGLGEGIVSGRIKPDHYIVSRKLEIISSDIAEKKTAITRNSEGKNQIIKLTEEKAKQQVLNNFEIKKLANYALKLEEHYSLAQDIEFAIDSGEIYIVQTRPITTLHKKSEGKEISGEVLLSGMAASPGIASGIVKIIKTMGDLDKIKSGDVLVTEMTNPDMVVAMQKSSAIITDEGGQTSHAAIVSREMGIPAVVGTGKATSILKNGDKVTVDGFKGRVYSGESKAENKKVEILPIVETKTKIKVMVDLPDFASRAAKTGCKEVGLTRLEGIIAESGEHPLAFIKKPSDYEKIIFEGLSKISEYFDEIWVRTSDIRTDEYRNLEGAPKTQELNPMLGMHGIRASLKYPELLKAELIAASKINKKIGIMMPQVISVEEVRQVKKLLDELEIKNLKLGVMIETPAAVQIIEELCKENIKFISFGTNDLTQYTLAIDRGNSEIQDLYDEMNPAVLRQLSSVIEVCKRYSVETSICGQAGSRKEMVEFLVRNRIDSISVNADKAYEISLLVKQLEEKGFGSKQEISRIAEKETRTEEKKSKKRFEAFCSSCKKKTDVPFKPDGVRPVYCKDCYEKARVEKMMNSQVEEKKQDEKEEVEEIKEVEEQIQNKKEETEEIAINVFDQQYTPISKEIISGEEQAKAEQVEEKAKKKEEEDSEIILDIF